MISLARAIARQDDKIRAALAIDTTVHLLDAMNSVAVPFEPGVSSEWKGALSLLADEWRADPQADPAPEHVSGACDAAEAIVVALNADWKNREIELAKMLDVIAEAGATIARTGNTQHHQLSALVRDIEAVRKLESITEMRRLLGQQVETLASIATKVQEEAQARSARLERQLRLTSERLRIAEALASTDDLTGLANRRAAEDALASYVAQAQPFSVALFDLDGFKLVNDKYGHACGDAILRLVGQSLKGAFREIDLVARMGGDEFLVILPQLQLAPAVRRVTNVQEAIAGVYLIGVNGQDLRLPVACSAGVAQMVAGEDADELLARSDAALYEDKKRRKAERAVHS